MAMNNNSLQKKREDKRFHGAFTGGFSAGYFNTVGSKEGWAPSSFQSSRSQPQSSSTENGEPSGPRKQRIEDFMDEDDDPLLGKRLGLNSQYDPLAADGSTQSQQFQAKQASTSSIPGFIVDDFIQPSRSTIGTTLLGKMGWKQGQGVGPKVRKRKFTSRFDPPEAALPATAKPNDDDDIIFIAPKHTLNIADIFPCQKLDKYGAGYDPYMNAPEFGFLQRRRQLEASAGGPPRAMLTFADSIRGNNTSSTSTTYVILQNLPICSNFAAIFHENNTT
ncbi:hypothetical protein AaE_010357 [Aphanomyces astaci]|uniref:G-patch domain-containing protein n=1 Tax=Aphanomyces astaci TaxID=112090 RepID=A0A6A5A8H2_APHAT|nr:hypothetical protein AaE_010357 [Aphanomyces astaci]